MIGGYIPYDNALALHKGTVLPNKEILTLFEGVRNIDPSKGIRIKFANGSVIEHIEKGKSKCHSLEY